MEETRSDGGLDSLMRMQRSTFDSTTLEAYPFHGRSQPLVVVKDLKRQTYERGSDHLSKSQVAEPLREPGQTRDAS